MPAETFETVHVGVNLKKRRERRAIPISMAWDPCAVDVPNVPDVW